MKLSLTINTGSGFMGQVESPCEIADYPESLKYLQFHLALLVIYLSLLKQCRVKLNTWVPQIIESGIRSPRHPPLKSIAQPPKSTQMITTWTLSRLLPHNQPSLKELILPQRPWHMCNWGRGDVESSELVSSHQMIIRL